MKKQLLIAIAFVLFVTNGQAETCLKGGYGRTTTLFQILPNSSEVDVKNDIRDAVFLELNLTELSRLNTIKPSLLSVTIPYSQNTNVKFDLHDAKILTDNFSVITGKNEKVNYTPGLYYQGTVAGFSPSLAGFSLFDNSIMAVFSYNNENYVLGLWNDKSNVNKTIYILYKDSNVLYARDFKCGVDAMPKKRAGNPTPGHLLSNQCIKVYFECEYQMFVDKGGAVNVTNYVTGMFNVIQALYNVEVVNTEISQIYVWSSADPYIPFTNTTDLLNNFQATRTTFSGNVAHLLTTKNHSAGGLAYLDIICDPANAYAVSNIDNTYLPYPNYCWTIEVVTHELGHNFGSHHTHWCGWPGGAIDNCYATEGGCGPGPTPANSGTIMSYCHLGGTGILLTNGFGTLPGGAIRSSFAAASCLTACISPPTADFTVSPAYSCTAPLTVTFTDHTFFSATSWAWDVDNNGTTDYVTQSPTHTYTTAGSYTVKLIVTNANGSDTVIKTNFINVGTIVPSVTTAITAGSSSICGGGSVTFTATPVNGGTTPTYQWYKNGVAIAGATNPTYLSVTLANNDVITCTVTSNAPCVTPATATSTGITMTVTPTSIPEVTVSVTSGSPIICLGTPASFFAAIANGGSTPTYQWQVNGANVGTNNPVFSSSTLATGDVVTCVLTSNAACVNPTVATSAPVTMTVNPYITPTVTTSISSGTNPTCATVPITFTATSTNGGTGVTYQWQKNGVNTVAGTTYIPLSPANGDIITCIVTSNASCLTSTTSTSAPITISLIPSPTPAVSVAMTSGTNPSCSGAPATFTATTTNAGTTPGYQWFLNGVSIAGATSQTYTPTTIIDGDVFSCDITSSATCPGTATSSGVAVVVPPVATINFISNINVCGRTIAATAFASNPSGASYTWSNSNTAIGLAASGTGNVPSFNATNTSSAPIVATITVTPSINGCSGTPSTYTITVDPTPIVTLTGTTLTSSTATSYQWYLNGQPIVGETSQVCPITLNGDYSVIIDGGTCPSNSFTIITAGIAQLSNDCFFNVYPNPNDGNFFISFDVPEKNNYTLRVVNSIGELIYKEVLTNFEGKYTNEMNFKTLSKGIYMVNLSSPTNDIVKKIIIY